MGGNLAHFPGTSPTSPLCRSSHKCMILTNWTSLEREVIELSIYTRFNANDHVKTGIWASKHKVPSFFFLDEFSVEFWVEGSIFNFCIGQDVLALMLLVEPLLKTVLWDPEEPLSSNCLWQAYIQYDKWLWSSGGTGLTVQWSAHWGFQECSTGSKVHPIHCCAL